MSTLINHHDEVTDQSQQVLLIRKRQTTPDRSWKYIDKAGKINGPFSTPEILEWWEKGYLRPSLMLSCEGMKDFSPLRVLWPDPRNAFIKSPQVPSALIERVRWSDKIPLDDDAVSTVSSSCSYLSGLSTASSSHNEKPWNTAHEVW
jgi:hypothetical protein